MSDRHGALGNTRYMYDLNFCNAACQTKCSVRSLSRLKHGTDDSENRFSGFSLFRGRQGHRNGRPRAQIAVLTHNDQFMIRHAGRGNLTRHTAGTLPRHFDARASFFFGSSHQIVMALWEYKIHMRFCKACSASHPGGNQVDGLPPVEHTGAGAI